MPCGFSRMPFAAEVDALKREIGCDQGVWLVTRCSPESEHRTVISDSSNNGGVPPAARFIGGGHPANCRYQRFLGQWHSLTTIKDCRLCWRRSQAQRATESSLGRLPLYPSGHDGSCLPPANH